MAAETNDGSTLEQQLRLIEDRFEIFNLIASNPPSADIDSGAEFPGLPDERPSPAGSANPEHYRSIEQGNCAFCQRALCADHRRHGVRDLLFSDPHTGPCCAVLAAGARAKRASIKRSGASG